METIRAWIEVFLRGRYSLAELGNRAFRVLAVAGLIGAILVVGWLLLGPMLTIPRFSPGGPVVRNGVAAVMVCGKKAGSVERRLMSASALKGLDAAMEYVPEPRTGGWWPVRSEASDCVTWYHRPPGLEQRQNRQERAANLSSEASPEMPQAEELRRSPSEFQRLPVVEKLLEAKR